MGEVKRTIYGYLGGGFSDQAPYGSQTPDAKTGTPFRDIQNMILRRGALRSGWNWTPLSATTYTNPTIEGNIASRQETAVTNAQYVVGGEMISTSFAGQKAYVIITDGEIYVAGQAMNPTYSGGGAVLYTAGSGTYALTGTHLIDRGIKVGDLFRPSSTEDYGVISEVSPNAVRAQTSSTYTIRRTFRRGVTPGKVSWAILNGDLYVAAQCGGIDPVASTSGWGILRVEGIFGTPSAATFILNTWDVTGSMEDKSVVSGIDEIVGLQATAEGRLVIATNEDGLGNRIRHSSHLDNTDWTGDTAGFTDLATTKADIKCLSRIGEMMVAYCAETIHVGIPTHQQHLPFSWRKAAAAQMGTRWYRGACESEHGNLLCGSDGHFYSFNGELLTPLTDGTILNYTRGPDQVYLTGETISGDTGTITFSAVDGSVTVA